MPPPHSDAGVEHAFLLSKGPTAQKPLPPPPVQDSFHRHAVTWFLIGGLLAIIGAFLAMYALPLVDKAHEVADEALDITSLAREKLESIDKLVGDFLEEGMALTVRLHTAIDELQATNTELREQLQEQPTSLEETNAALQPPN